VLYASSLRLGCFLETLARFRLDLTLLAELAEIEGEDDFTPLGTVPREWCASRVIGSGRAFGSYADIYASEWIGRLRTELAAECVNLGVADLDASALQRTLPRRLTQLASRVVYEAGFDGIRYRSKYGHDIRNWALFEPFLVLPGDVMEIAQDDVDLAQAMRIHGLGWS